MKGQTPSVMKPSTEQDTKYSFDIEVRAAFRYLFLIGKDFWELSTVEQKNLMEEELNGDN